SPRTLHLSLAGLRDLTLLETPPKDRSPVVPFIEPWDDGLIEEALARELDRAGQVYFVHNRIETIDTVAERVRALAPPRARVVVAHGKLKEATLDDVMARFVRGEVDILVSTMIVESGLGRRTANPVRVSRASQPGLAAQAVGFDTYLRWLQETVDALKGTGDGGRRTGTPPEVVLDQPAHLSDDYVPDEAAKLELYRRLARAGAASEIEAVREELRDRFGPLPDDARRLLLVSEL